MPLSLWFKRPRDDRQRFFQSLPEPARLQLTLAVFFTFCVIGVVNDLWVIQRLRPWSLMILLTVGSGLTSAVGVQALMRGPRWRIAAVVFPLVFFLAIRAYPEPVLTRAVTIAAIHQRLVVDGLVLLATTVAGYALFIAFISRSGLQQLRLQTEFELAAGIHDALVPAISTRFGALDVYGRAHPSTEVGGDLFDAFPSGADTIACVADVSGHGVPAGTLMAMVRSAVRTRLRSHAPLPQVLGDLNQLLLEMEQRERFVTVALMRFDGDQVELANAGHLPVLCLRAGALVCESYESTAPPTGVESGRAFESRSIPVHRGDLFVLYSDGLSEVVDRGGRQFGTSGIERVVLAHANRSLSEIHDAVLAAVRAHGPQTDDQTLLLVRRVA